jgi:predicted RNA binding protein YcfA (HicA-like mRNA interferase family)
MGDPVTDLDLKDVIAWLTNQGFQIIRLEGNELTIRLP